MRVRRGFTILEAVVALAIVGIAAVAALATAGGELRAAARAEQALEVTALLQDRIAAARLGMRRSPLALPDSIRRGRFGGSLAGYEWESRVAPARAGDDRVAELRVTVRWSDGERTVATRTYLPPEVTR
jgi:type II secretion system protein I